MQEVFEKIIEKLEEKTSFLSDCTKYGNKDAEQQNKSYSTMMMYEVADLIDDLIEIIKQEAEQFKGGWIPVSEKLPEESLNSVIGWDEYRERCCFVQYIGGRFVLGDDTEPVKITHWMYLPYQPKGE